LGERQAERAQEARQAAGGKAEEEHPGQAGEGENMGSEAIDLEEILEEIGIEEANGGEEAPDEGDAGDRQTIENVAEVDHARRIALEECLHTIAGYALELETGKRESITAEDLRVAFAAHEVEEIYDEAKIFFDAGIEDSDLEDAGPGEEADEEDGEEDDSEEDFEGDEVAEGS
jgi:hypothetical protein